MNNSETSPTPVRGVNSAEGLKLFVFHRIRRYFDYANYFGSSLEDTTAIEITVGHKDEEVSWILPKSLLTHHSKFFDAALNGTFAESNSRTMTMPEDSSDVFRLFVQWLYVGDFKISDVEAWLEAWVFGDKTGNIAFRDCAMTKLINHHYGRVLRGATVATAYRKSVAGSKLRKWALDQFRWQQRDGELHDDVGDWVSVVENETDFATDVTRAMIRRDYVGVPIDQLNLYLGA